MTLAKSERRELCDLLLQIGPDAPTLCEGWTTHDLAAHLWVRETDPLAAAGMIAKPLGSLTERRMAEAKEHWPYPELVERIRSGPVRFSVFAIPGLDEGANSTEFFIHHEDVRRAGDPPMPPRDLGAENEDWLWRRMKLQARAFFRRAAVGVVLERTPNTSASGAAAPDEPETIRASSGAQTVTMVGLPSELMLYATGRRGAAHVHVIGEDDALASLGETDLHA